MGILEGSLSVQGRGGKNGKGQGQNSREIATHTVSFQVALPFLSALSLP
jgi:hypothetical protein